MAITRISSREFNQDVSAAKKAARNGPVLITDRGRPAHVLPAFTDRILPVDTATAIVHGMTVVTRNTAAFKPIGVSLLNPWQA